VQVRKKLAAKRRGLLAVRKMWIDIVYNSVKLSDE
jgi:hypothetical protein